jgi:aminoglycoside 6'-N-acetyltransferase
MRFQAYRTDAEVGKYQGWTPTSNEEALAFLTEMSLAEIFAPGKWVQLAIADRLSNNLIGDIGVCVATTGEEAEIGFTLDSRSQGRGLATEALLALKELLFASTNIQRIVAITDTRNLASIRLLERIGMVRVRTESASFRGEPCEEHAYELARS